MRSGERRGEFKKTGSWVCDKGVKSEFLHFVQCTKKNRDIL
nr:MAG TPA: Methanol dehydrogenase subunit 1 [Caudoviricetes sp.]